MPAFDCTVLQVDTNVAVLVSTDPTISYPGTSKDGYLVITTGAGVFNCAFAAKQGQPVYAISGGTGQMKVNLAYTLPSQNPT